MPGKWKEPRPCAECGHLMRPMSQREEDFPGTRVHMGLGLCSVCMRARRSGVDDMDLDDGAARPGPRKQNWETAATNYAFLGNYRGPVELVQWASTKDGPQLTSVCGTFSGSTSSEWLVDTGDEVERFPRAMWEVTVP